MDRPSSLLRRWIAACAIGETLGIALAACWWVAVDRIDPEPVTLTAKLAMLAAKSAAGIVEGGVLGMLQAWALRLRYPALSPTDWTLATIALAVLGWAVALPAIYLAASADLGLGLAGVALGGLAGGAIAGALLGAVTSLAFAHMPPRDQ